MSEQIQLGGFPETEWVRLIHAAWVDTEPGKAEWKKGNMNMACSNCKHRAGKYKHKTYRYCPWCGAKMDIPVAKPERIADELVREITFVGKLSAKEMPSP